MEEANALIPRVKEICAAVAALTDAAGPSPKVNGSNGHNGSGRNGSNGNGAKEHGGTTGQDILSNLKSLSPGLREKAIRALFGTCDEMGIVVQDIYTGLVDFPAIINGREIFLCYKLSDGDSIQFYHELDAGFAGRRSLKELY